jgi:hypothetical protein
MKHKNKFAKLAVGGKSLLCNTLTNLSRTLSRVTGSRWSKAIQFNLNKALLSGIAMLACVSMAHAQSGSWGPAQEYDIGFNPSVAISGTTVVEVHNGQNNYGPMWYHVGQQNPNTGAITWGPSYNYDNGYNPAVAISGTTVVEVHNGQIENGPMWYHVGQINGSTIKWGPSYKYDSGYNPTVALVATCPVTPLSHGCLIAVEAHNSSATAGNMYYHVGQVGTTTRCGFGSWCYHPDVINFGPSNYYDTGWNPSVAAAPCVTNSGASCGMTILEVHNGQAQAGPMWYHVGTWTSGSKIAWGPSTYYDTGYNPKVAIAHMGSCGGNEQVYLVMEVHDGGIETTLGEQALWSHPGTWNANSGLYLGPSYHYDSGWNPSVAVAQGPYTVNTPVEVHNGNQDLFGTGPIPMWFHVGQFGWCIE